MSVSFLLITDWEVCTGRCIITHFIKDKLNMWQLNSPSVSSLSKITNEKQAGRASRLSQLIVQKKKTAGQQSRDAALLIRHLQLSNHRLHLWVSSPRWTCSDKTQTTRLSVGHNCISTSSLCNAPETPTTNRTQNLHTRALRLCSLQRLGCDLKTKIH